MKKRIKQLLLVGAGCTLAGMVGTFGYCSFMECDVEELIVTSYDDCVEQGFPVENSDPPKCIVNKEKIFEKPAEHIRVTTPNANTVLNAPVELSGEALVLDNTVYYRLKNAEQEILQEGSVVTNSPEHGRYGTFEVTLDFDPRDAQEGVLEVFEKTPLGVEESLQKIPVRFVSPSDTDNSEEISSFQPLSDAPITLPVSVEIPVPFTPQAPFADWSATFNEACEEASLIMVEYFLRDKALTQNLANAEIIALVDWETQNGYAVDVSTDELATIARTHFGRKAVTYKDEEVTIENIQRLLAGGHPVIIPAAGKELGNPYFRGDGPPYHMLVITGYDKEGFIVHDPGTRRGENFRYSFDTVINSIHDWTGSKDTVPSGPKAIVVIGF